MNIDLGPFSYLSGINFPQAKNPMLVHQYRGRDHYFYYTFLEGGFWNYKIGFTLTNDTGIGSPVVPVEVPALKTNLDFNNIQSVVFEPP